MSASVHFAGCWLDVCKLLGGRVAQTVVESEGLGVEQVPRVAMRGTKEIRLHTCLRVEL